jgi:hypothetical protein
MFLLKYEHKHGTDTFICEDKKVAQQISFSLMCLWFDDELCNTGGEDRLQIANSIKNGDWETAANLWADCTDEAHNITEENTFGPQDVPDYAESLERIFSELEEE